MSKYQSTTDRDYPLANNPEADHWLDEAIMSQPLYFAEPSDKDLDPDSPINLSRFGLHNATQVKAFLSSSAGETLKTEIKAQAALDEAIEEQHMFELREQEKQNQLIKAHLLLWLIEKKGMQPVILESLLKSKMRKLFIKASLTKKKLKHQKNHPK